MSGKARFVPAPNLDALVAEKIGRPAVARALDMLEESAKAKAPPVKVWVTMRDERVRPTHHDADRQAVPANLRFKIEHPTLTGTFELARHPRDPALSVGNAANCRCDDSEVPHLLADSIHSTDLIQTGAKVTGAVETDFPRAAESEYGTGEDAAAHFMTGALREVALRLSQGHAR